MSRQLLSAAFLAACLTVSLTAYEQTTITGTVKGQASGRSQGRQNASGRNLHPLPGASISLKGTLSGTTSDSTGHFSFIADTKGQQVLVVSSIGYKEQEMPIYITDTALNIDLVLFTEEKTMEPVVISAGSFIASDKARGASLTPVDVVTTAGNNGDIANALRTLPGTQTIGEQEGLFVRGGTSDEARQFVDGTLFRNPNFSSVPGITQPARVSPFLFNGIVFSSGGYSALYGEAMSGALILESVDLPDKSSAIVGISPIVAVAGFQELDPKRRYSYGVNTRYLDYYPYSRVIKQQPDYFHGPEYLYGDANFRIRTGKGGMLKYYVNAGYNHTGLRRPDIDSLLLKSGFELKGLNVYNNLSYRGYLGSDWKIDIGATYTYNKDDITRQLLTPNNKLLYLGDYPYSGKNTRALIESNYAEGKVVLTRFIGGGHILRFGADEMFSDDHYANGGTSISGGGPVAGSSSDSLTILKNWLTSVFAEADLRLSRNLAAKAGLRYEYSSLLKASSLAPRLSLGYRIGGVGQFNAAYGVFYQATDNRYFRQSRNPGFSYAVHYMLNYIRTSNSRTFRVEAYYKQYYRLPRLSADSMYVNTGDGYARGIELFWRDKKTVKDLDYWITYTFIDTKRNYLNYPYQLRPTFATPHTASLVLKRFFQPINTSVNVAYTFATGRPYYNIVSDHNGRSRLEDQGTTAPYHNVNLSVSYLCSLFPHARNKDFTIIAFGMNNVLGTNQVFGYNYSNDGLNKVPVTLPAPRSLFAGIFVNFGIDRRNQNLDDNL